MRVFHLLCQLFADNAKILHNEIFGDIQADTAKKNVGSLAHSQTCEEKDIGRCRNDVMRK